MKFKYKKKMFNIKGASDDDHIHKAIVKNRCFYEIDLLEYMVAIKNYFVDDDSIAIDVGANIGNHSIFFQSFIANSIISVEPNPAVLPVLKENLENNIGAYTLYKNGLGEFGGKGSVALPEGSENNAGMAKIEIGEEGDVEIITLDSMLADWKTTHTQSARVAMIKVDVEGMELQVLKGAKDTLESDKPELFLEAASTAEFDSLYDYLKTFGYEVLSCWAATPVYHFSVNPSNELKDMVEKAKSASKWNKFKRKIMRRVYKIM